MVQFQKFINHHMSEKLATIRGNSLKLLTSEILAAGDPEKATLLQRFFKTGPGEYAEGDIFLGLTMPIQRSIAKKYPHLTLHDLDKLITSEYHEFRMIALIILMTQMKRAVREQDELTQKAIYDFYLAHTENINNWDLVDLSACRIVGEFLLTRPREILYRLVKSENLWERRIAIIATACFISHRDFGDTLQIAELLLYDKHDLIHKAVGWMLREVGKRDRSTLDKFLVTHYPQMPRTTLRYAIERYPEAQRKNILKGQFN